MIRALKSELRLRSRGRRRVAIVILPLLLLLAPAAVGVWAQVDPELERPGAGDEELRRALRQHFQNRLRAELGLTDEQMAEVWPKVERLEKQRRQMQRERSQTARELRRAYHEGASDVELQALLDRLIEVEERAHAAERQMQREIDQVLTVRQRVQMRFVVTRFRQEVRRRIQEIRRERSGGMDSPRRRRWQERPPEDDLP